MPAAHAANATALAEAEAGRQSARWQPHVMPSCNRRMTAMPLIVNCVSSHIAVLTKHSTFRNSKRNMAVGWDKDMPAARAAQAGAVAEVEAGRAAPVGVGQRLVQVLAHARPQAVAAPGAALAAQQLPARALARLLVRPLVPGAHFPVSSHAGFLPVARERWGQRESTARSDPSPRRARRHL